MRKLEFLSELEDLMELAPKTLNDESVLTEFSNWDSMMILGFIVMAEQKLGYVVEGKTVGKANTVQDLFNIVKDYLQD